MSALDSDKKSTKERALDADNVPTKCQPKPVVINKTFVDSQLAPGRYRDTRLTGFVLRVTPAGTKTYCVDTRVKGTRERVTYSIGIHGKDGMTAEKARRQADEIISNYIKKGLNPHEAIRKQQAVIEKERAEEKAACLAGTHTLSSVLKDYLAKKKLKKSSAYNYQCVITANMRDWLNKPLIEISKDMISDRHRQISDKSPGMADNTMRVLRALFTFAGYEYEELSGHPAIAVNPCRKLSQQKQWNRLARRQTVIRKADIKPWFDSVKSLHDHPTVRDYLLMLLLTGLRKAEAESLRWADVNLRSKQFKIQETKNHVSLELPMSDYLYGILLRRWQERDNDVWVFPGRGDEGHITNIRGVMDKLIKASGVDFDLHDLRRTFITIADGLGIGAYTIKKLVNHKSAGDVTAGYFVADVERLRQPMQEITDYILQQVGELPPDKSKTKKRTGGVVSINAAKR